MLKQIDWPELRQYRTGSDFEPFEFYLSSFANSKEVDLLLGYFSFSAVGVLSLGFAHFIANGGTLRIVANDILSRRDKDTLLYANEPSEHDDLIDLTNLKDIKDRLDPFSTHFFECMAWLVRNNRLQIVLIRPKEKKGIAHFKSGIFRDNVSKVGFSGSCNFTAYGITANLESLEILLDWDDNLAKRKIENLEDTFENIFFHKDDSIEYVPVKNAKLAIEEEFGEKGLEELIKQEYSLRSLDSKLPKNSRLTRIIEDLAPVESISGPHFPVGTEPRAYQIEAFNNWVSNSHKGIFSMATGTGKTITSLFCILEDYTKNKYYRTLVLVPSLPLALQWEQEATTKFNFSDVLVCSSANPSWEEELRTQTKSIAFGNNSNLFVIATYSTYQTSRFQSAFFDILGSISETVTLIADEAHTMGSPGMLKKLPHQINKRIGLSATPSRVYDDLGGKKIQNFFQAEPPKYTFRYTMKEAIDNDILCEYNYHPVFFALTQSEIQIYQNFTEKLRKHIDPKTGKYRNNEIVNTLLIQRKNVIHKAKNKLYLLIETIRAIGPENFKYAFIYVPEGSEPNYEIVDKFNLSPDDKHLIKLYTQYLYSNFKFSLKTFTGETPNREEILEHFRQGKYDALLAMKCLDEGVDIPRAQYAIFCSSTGNPRQFIQRRGRVLRKHPDKDRAIIYDLIAAPVLDKLLIDNKQLITEKNIFSSELRRVVNFAALANNCSELLNGELASICRSLDINLSDMLLEELKTYN